MTEENHECTWACRVLLDELELWQSHNSLQVQNPTNTEQLIAQATAVLLVKIPPNHVYRLQVTGINHEQKLNPKLT